MERDFQRDSAGSTPDMERKGENDVNRVNRHRLRTEEEHSDEYITGTHDKRLDPLHLDKMRTRH